MTTNIDLEYARTNRAQLENLIFGLIEDYERRTGLRVTKIYIGDVATLRAVGEQPHANGRHVLIEASL